MHPWSHLDTRDARWRIAARPYRTPEGHPVVRGTVRVAGLPLMDGGEVDRIAALMEVGAWVHRMTDPVDTATHRDPSPRTVDNRRPTTPY